MDSAFKSAMFPGFSLVELKKRVILFEGEARKSIEREIERREKVLSGDMSVATDGERLRALKRIWCWL